jgi:hypothetical protein
MRPEHNSIVLLFNNYILTENITQLTLKITTLRNTGLLEGRDQFLSKPNVEEARR